MEIGRDNNSFLSLPRSTCNSTKTSPLKDNTLLLNMNGDFFSAQHSSNNEQDFLNLEYIF